VKSLHVAWRSIAAATGYDPTKLSSVNVSLTPDMCNSPPITEAEEAFSYALDALLKLAYVLMQNVTELNTTQPVTAPFHGDIPPPHLFQSRFRYPVVDTICCLRAPDIPLSRPDGYALACDDVVIVAMRALDRSVCKAMGSTTVAGLMCFAMEMLGMFDAQPNKWSASTTAFEPSIWSRSSEIPRGNGTIDPQCVCRCQDSMH
jgi:hypothetical protein